MAGNFFDQFDPSTARPEGKGGGNFFDQFDPSTAKPAPTGGTLSDLGKSIKAGVQRLPGMVTGLADLPIALATGKRPVTAAADALGEATGFQPGKWADETKFSPAYEAGRQNVDEAWKDGSAGDIALAYLKNPGYTANQVAESLPSMVAGGVLGRAAMGAGAVTARAANAATGTAARAATPGVLARTVGEKWAAPVAAGIGEGVVTAGQQMDQAQGEDQQRNAVAALGAGALTGAIGVGAGRAANRLGLETAETAMAKIGTGATTEVPLSAKRRILGGMVSEALLQELPQSAQEQMWQNYAEGKPLMEGVARASTEGAIAGGVMGAGANVSGGANRRARQADQQARQRAEDAAASANQLAEEASIENLAGQPINPVDLGAPASFEDLVTPRPQAEPDPYTAWDQQVQAGAPATQPGAGAPGAPAQPAGPAVDPYTDWDEHNAAVRDFLGRPQDGAQQRPDYLAEVQAAVRSGTQFSTQQTVDTVRDAMEDAWLAQNVGAEPAGAPAPGAGLQAADAMGVQLQDQFQQASEDAGIAAVDARVRTGRILSGLQNLLDGGAQNTAQVLGGLNEGLARINERPLDAAETQRVRRMVDAYMGFRGVGEPAPLPADRGAPAVDPFADNAAMEALIPQRPMQRPSERLGINPADGPLSRGAARAVDAGFDAGAPAQENPNAQGALARAAATAAPAANPIPGPGAMEAAGPGPLTQTTGATFAPQADQAQQAGAQPSQTAGAPGAPAVGAPAAQELTNAGATTQNLGAQGGAAPGPQGQAQGANEVSAAREVSREIGKYKEGLSEFRAEQMRTELARRNRGVIYTVERDGALKNGFVVVGREPIPGKSVDAQRLLASKGRSAKLQFSHAPRGPQDFVPNSDGGLDYGEISPQMAKAMRRQAGKIRLTEGVQNANGTGYGLRHVEANHGQQIRALGFDDVTDFIAHIGRNLQQVWQIPGGSQLLASVKNGRKDVMYIQLEISDAGEFYRVNTAFPVRQADYESRHGMKKVWDGSEPTSAVTGQRPAFATAAIATPDAESSQGSSNARGQAASVSKVGDNANISGEQRNVGGPQQREWAVEIAGGADPKTALAQPRDVNPGRSTEDGPSVGEEGAGPEFSRTMSPELAQAIRRLRPPPATNASVRQAVNQLVNGMGMLPNRLGRIVVTTSDDIRANWEPLIGPVAMGAEGGGKAQGFFDPQTKTVFLISDHIVAGDELGVVAHELMHKHGQAVLGEEGWNQLHSAIEGWASAPEGSQERQVYNEAAKRVRESRPADGDAQAYSSQELFPYAVQVALEMGVRPNGLAKPGTVARWLAQVRSMLRQVWNKIAGSKGDFNTLDLVNLAFGIAQRENPAMGQALDTVSLQQAERAQQALRALSDEQDLFALPRSNADTVAGIAAEHDAGIQVRQMQQGGETQYQLTMPDGTHATITSREPTAQETFGMDEVTGQAITDRPGEKAPPVGARSDVWLDVSRLTPGRWGAVVYNIASTFAHNTGRIFIGDPAGLSDVAMVRRPEQMLSSALKFGTTDHLAPHPRQVAGDAALGVPPLRWVYGDHAGNIARLVDVTQATLDNGSPAARELTYDLDSGTFTNQRTGERRTLAELARSSLSRGREGAERPARAGWRTIARGAVLHSLLEQRGAAQARESGSGGRMPGSGRGALLDEPVRQPDQSDSTANSDSGRGSRLLADLAGQRDRIKSEDADGRIFYSRSVGATPTASDYTPEQARAAEHAFGTQVKQTWAERAQAMRHNIGTKLRQGLVDQFAPIKEVSEKAYILARLSKGSDGAVEAALLYGKPYLRDGVADVDIKDGGFAQVLASLKGEHDRFFQWVAAQRAQRLKAEGKENLLTDRDITALRSLDAGRMADGTARMPLYAAALRELNAFNEASLRVARDSGLIDQAAYDLMKDQPYVPFYRLMEEDGGMRGPRFSSGLVNQQAWKKLKGGTQQLNADLLQNTLMNWSHLYAAAARNRASLETMAAAERLGVAYQVPADTKGAIKVMRDGVAEHWAVEDPYLLDAISAMSYTPPGIVKAMAPFKRLLTFGVTVNPTFKIRNLIRDSLSAIAQSDLSYNPAENVAKGWKATGRNSQTYASMLASGGIIKFGTQENTNQLRGQIERLGGTMLDKQGFDKLKDQMRSLWETYETFGDRLENVNRTALYERLRAKGLSHAEASFQARDLMDFSMSGKWETVRFLAQTVPFLNARLQGLYKLGRAAGEDPRRFAAMAGAVSLASLGLLAAYGDDDDWKKREDFDRDNFWWFKIGDKAFRIPKPFEVGAIGTVAERTAELMMSEEMTGKRFGQRISDMVFNTFAMDPTPQAIKPFLDVYANKDSFSGRAIEGMADERLRPQDRYNERTSEVARLLGSWGLPDPVRLAKGEYSGLSPKQVDFLLRGYFGWLATVSTTATDTIARPLLDRGERPSLRLRDTFVAGNFVEQLPTGSSRYVTTMYEQAREVEQAWASHQAAIKSGDVELARSIQEEEGPKLRNRLAINAAKQQMAELGQRAKKIDSDRLLSGEAKREQLNEIEQRRNAIAQRVAGLTG